ncbi:MAG TPA: hydroxymethylbilane synthase [Micromonosporaceae bacterium]|nr:hydroxymethylbilane synthase [Micromonosporaceae bacterium]
MSASPLRLGTRGSALALAQSRSVADALRAATGLDVELVEITTAGDRSAAPVQQLGVGVFVSALRDALLAKEIDFAVHSYKDLPTAPADGLAVAAVPPRADARDALVSAGGRTLSQLPAGARVGTGALRRMAQLNALGLQLEVVPIRGNVDSRLRKVAEGELDAVVLARAGIARLGRADEITETLDPMLMLPAPAQGALAVECRVDAVIGDRDLVDVLGSLDDPASRAAVTAERALLATLEAGCSAPVAALADLADGDEGEEIYLRGAVISPDGSHAVRLSRTGTPADAARIGRALAADLLDAGADTVLGAQR